MRNLLIKIFLWAWAIFLIGLVSNSYGQSYEPQLGRKGDTAVMKGSMIVTQTLKVPMLATTDSGEFLSPQPDGSIVFRKPSSGSGSGITLGQLNDSLANYTPLYRFLDSMVGLHGWAYAVFQPVLGYTPENVANKATSFGTLNNTLYPTTAAVNTFLNAALLNYYTQSQSDGRYVHYSDTPNVVYSRYDVDTAKVAIRGAKVNYTDTAGMLSNYARAVALLDTAAAHMALILSRVKYGDTANMLNPYLRSAIAAATYVPATRTITVGGTTKTLAQNDTFNIYGSYGIIIKGGDTALVDTGTLFPLLRSFYPAETDPVATAKTITLNHGYGTTVSGTATQTEGSNPGWTVAADTTAVVPFTDTSKSFGLATKYWVKSQAYMTAFVEIDPVYIASIAYNINAADTTKWTIASQKWTSSGTYSSGTITFTRNDGTTWTVTGIPNTSYSAGWGLSGGPTFNVDSSKILYWNDTLYGRYLPTYNYLNQNYYTKTLSDLRYIITESDPVANAKTITGTNGYGITGLSGSGQALSTNPSLTPAVDTTLVPAFTDTLKSNKGIATKPWVLSKGFGNGTITYVGNSDGSIIISVTSGSVTVSFNPANNVTFSGTVQTNKGVIFPSVNATPATPATGNTIFSTSANVLSAVTYQGSVNTLVTSATLAGGSLAGSYPNPTIASSVSLPGSPTTTTQAIDDNSTDVATDAFVVQYIPADTSIAASYTLTARDKYRTLHSTASSGITVTVPTSLGTRFTCTVIQEAAGNVTFSASSTTLTYIPTSTTKTKQSGSIATIRSWATANSFTVQGDLQ
jgi:hypothetical protein